MPNVGIKPSSPEIFKAPPCGNRQMLWFSIYTIYWLWFYSSLDFLDLEEGKIWLEHDTGMFMLLSQKIPSIGSSAKLEAFGIFYTNSIFEYHMQSAVHMNSVVSIWIVEFVYFYPLTLSQTILSWLGRHGASFIYATSANQTKNKKIGETYFLVKIWNFSKTPLTTEKLINIWFSLFSD